MSLKTNVTFITGHLAKERHALLYELALDLSENGATVTVITGFPSRRIDDETRNYYLNNPVEKINENLVIKRVGSKKGEGNGLLSRMVKYLFLTKRLYKEAKRTKTDAYYIYSSPPFLGYLGKKLSKIAPTLYNAQDIFPDSLITIKNLSEKNLMIKYFRKKEKQVYKYNSKIVTISETMKKNIIDQGCDSQKIEVIYNWADTSKLYPVKKEENRLYETLNIDKKKFIVSYAGDIGLFQCWDCILEVAKRMKEINKEIVFEFIGDGSYLDKMKKYIEKENITNIHLHPMQKQDVLAEVYSIGDVELAPIATGLTKYALPSKICNIMAVGKPILALLDKESEFYEIINDNNMGIAIEPNNVELLLKTIIELFEMKKDLCKMGENAVNFINNNCYRQLQTKKYYNVLYNIAQKR